MVYAMPAPKVDPEPRPSNIQVARHTVVMSDTHPTSSRQIASGSDGTIWLVWAQQASGGTYDVICSRIRGSENDDGDGWTFEHDTETVVSGAFAPKALALSVGIDDEPMVLVVIEYLTVYYAYPYQRSAGTWTVKTAQSLGYRVEWLSLVVTSGGTWNVLYPSWSVVGNHNIGYRTSSDNFTTWSAASLLASNTTIDNGTPGYIGLESRGALAIDESDGLHAVFCYVTNVAVYQVRYRYKASGGSWAAAETIETVNSIYFPKQSYSQCMVSLALDKNGAPWVSYCAANTNEYTSYRTIYVAERTAGSWSARTAVAAEYPHDWMYPALSLEISGDSDQIAHIIAGGEVSEDAATFNRLHHFRFDGTDWSGPQLLATPAGNSSVISTQLLHGLNSAFNGTLASGYLGSFATVGGSASLGGLVWDRNAIFKGAASASTTVTVGQTLVVSIPIIAVSAETEVGVIQLVDPGTSFYADAENEVAVAQAVIFEPMAYTVVTVTQEADASGSSINASASSSVSVDHGATRVGDLLCETDFVPSPSIGAAYDENLYVELSGPYSAPTRIVRLPRPMWNDQRQLDVRVVTQRNRAGQPQQFAKSNPIYILRLTWQGMDRRRVIEVDDFLFETKGRSIRYLDHEGVGWRVTVEETPVPFTYGDTKDHDNRLELVLKGTMET